MGELEATDTVLRAVNGMLSTGTRCSIACGSLALLGLVAVGDGHAADSARGRALFEECAACHGLDGSATDEALGPSLAGILNRRAGSRADFRYSRALSTSDIVWTLETIETFVADPQGFVRGNRMAYAGMPDPVDRADLMAYLAENLTAE